MNNALGIVEGWKKLFYSTAAPVFSKHPLVVVQSQEGNEAATVPISLIFIS